MDNTRTYSMIAVILLFIGGINYLFIGLVGGDLISSIFGHFLARVLFFCIGVATCYLIYLKAMKKEIYH